MPIQTQFTVIDTTMQCKNMLVVQQHKAYTLLQLKYTVTDISIAKMGSNTATTKKQK